MKTTKNQTITIYFLSFLFLPGVIIHEFSHLLSASLLFVPVGEIEFIPKVSENGVKLGSVKIGKTDFLRRAVIGFAPIVAGIGIMTGFLYYFTPAILNFPKISFLEMALIFYVVFQLGNTMFSSRKDVEGALELLILIGLIGITLYFSHIKVFSFLTQVISSPKITTFLRNIDFLFAIPLIINFIFILFLKIVLSMRSNKNFHA